MPHPGAISIILALLLVICAGEALYVWVIQPWLEKREIPDWLIEAFDAVRVFLAKPRWFL